MSRNFWSDYANHCLRFYARHPRPYFRNNVDRLNWNACDRVLRGFGNSDKEMLLAVYRGRETLPENIESVAKTRRINPDVIWHRINEVEKKVAKERGLL